MKTIKTIYSDSKKYLETIINKMESNKMKLQEFYLKNYKYRELYNGESYEELKEKDFDKLFGTTILYLNKQISFINTVLSLNIDNSIFSKQMIQLLEDCANEMKYDFIDEYSPEMLFDLPYKQDYSISYKSIELLSKFEGIRKNVVLIGGNGSGKSTFAAALKGNDTNNISVIPAQKTLYFSLHDKELLSSRVEELRELLLEDNITKSKVKEEYSYYSFQNNQFTKLIVAIREEHVSYLMRCEEKGNFDADYTSIFQKLNHIFSLIFPEMQLTYNDKEDYLSCIKKGEKYHINSLSEGEKAVIYYCGSTLMARENSYIVVDEPETYLNPSIVNTMWDLLIEHRADCQFIFITHSVDFAIGRNDAKLAWIKSFTYPDKWEFQFIDGTFPLPKQMLTEVLGSLRPILFCEGDNKNSLDYSVYQALLGEKFTVIPVGGHLQVIKCCETLRKEGVINRDCIGLIDGDNHSAEVINTLTENNIYVLPFNEIEMLFVSDIVMEYVLRSIRPVDYIERINNFKKAFWKRIDKDKETNVLKKLKVIIDEYIEHKRIENFDSVSEIKNGLKAISDFEIDRKYEEYKKELELIIKESNYDALLISCNLKKAISCGLANQYLDDHYEEKAKQQIMCNNELKSKLLEKYFKFIEG